MALMAVATPWTVRDAIAARIAELVPSVDYKQADPDAWRESIDVILNQEPDHRSQLAFFVDDRRVEQADHHRGNANEGEYVETPIDVQFLYRFRPLNRIADWNAAAKAAAALMNHLIDWDDTDPAMTITLGQVVLDREVLDTPDWLMVRTEFIVQYQLSLDE